ncbi:hypothetical protein Tsubulata_012674, partial [Turnera subulata]
RIVDLNQKRVVDYVVCSLGTVEETIGVEKTMGDDKDGDERWRRKMVGTMVAGLGEKMVRVGLFLFLFLFN